MFEEHLLEDIHKRYLPKGHGLPGYAQNGNAFRAFLPETCQLGTCKYQADQQHLGDGSVPVFELTREPSPAYLYATAIEARELASKSWTVGPMAFRLLSPSH